MTEEQQRIALAEWRGWKQCQWNGAYGTLKGVPPVKPSSFIDLPDYPNDRNALHEVMRAMTAAQWWDWEHVAAKMALPRGSTSLLISVMQMTTPQLAESILRTLNLWKDS